METKIGEEEKTNSLQTISPELEKKSQVEPHQKIPLTPTKDLQSPGQIKNQKEIILGQIKKSVQNDFKKGFEALFSNIESKNIKPYPQIEIPFEQGGQKLDLTADSV